MTPRSVSKHFLAVAIACSLFVVSEAGASTPESWPEISAPELPGLDDLDFPECPHWDRPDFSPNMPDWWDSLPTPPLPEIPKPKLPEIGERGFPKCPRWDRPDFSPSMPDWWDSFPTPSLPEIRKPELPEIGEMDFPEFPHWDGPDFSPSMPDRWESLLTPSLPEIRKREFPKLDDIGFPEWPQWDGPDFDLTVRDALDRISAPVDIEVLQVDNHEGSQIASLGEEALLDEVLTKSQDLASFPFEGIGHAKTPREPVELSGHGEEVPEPSTFVAICGVLGSAGLMALRRRSRVASSLR